MRGEPLKLVDGGKAQRTFLYIKDAIQAVMLMIVRGGGWVGLGFRVQKMDGLIPVGVQLGGE